MLISESSFLLGLITSKFRSSGQTCVCANRIFIHSSIIDLFATRLAAKLAETFHFGSVWDKDVSYGPLYSSKAFSKINAQVNDALSKGAKLLVGGGDSKSNSRFGPNFYPPTILMGGSKDMLYLKEETFGPVAFLLSFDNDEEVIQQANSVNAGLASYFYTENISRIWKVSEALEYGMVGVKVGLVSACEQPFGGIKESGIGREGGKDALDEYTDVKSVTVGL